LTGSLERAAEVAFRVTSPKMVAMLARMLRDLDRAEEIAQDAFVEALTRWTETGIPDNPSGWLMTAARHRAIDALRRARREGERNEALAHVLDDVTPAAFDETSDLVVEDDLLRLVFVACHPVLSEEARVALTLRLLCGLSAEEIARAFLVPETTIAQRITRAKRTIAEQRIPFTLPSSEDLEARLASVRTVVYLVFNAGY
jgi:RNA polymerase sigma factor (sigma-70 family)